MKPSNQMKKPLVSTDVANQESAKQSAQPNHMQVLPSEILNSNYKGALASAKYFTPKELNNLSKINKATGLRPPSGTNRVQHKELRKAELT